MKKKLFHLLWTLFAPIRKLTSPAQKEVAGEIQKVTLPNDRMLGQVKEFIKEGHTVTIYVKGYSMRPFLEHCRDRVILAPYKELKVNDIALAEIRLGVYVLHRIIKMEGERITLMGDGNIRGVEYCKKENVAGIVKTLIRNGVEIDAEDPKWIARAIRWRRLLPIRRYLLYIYKLNLESKS